MKLLSLLFSVVGALSYLAGCDADDSQDGVNGTAECSFVGAAALERTWNVPARQSPDSSSIITFWFGDIDDSAPAESDEIFIQYTFPLTGYTGPGEYTFLWGERFETCVTCGIRILHRFKLDTDAACWQLQFTDSFCTLTVYRDDETSFEGRLDCERVSPVHYCANDDARQSQLGLSATWSFPFRAEAP